VTDHVSVCEYCGGAFDQTAAVEESGVEAVAEHDGHPSLRSLVADGYEILTC
jgi:hypothetical protein